MDGTSREGMRERNKKRGVICGVSDRIDVLLQGCGEMDLAGAHADDYGAMAGGLDDSAEYGVLGFLGVG